MQADTIFALSTGMGRAGVAVIRLSGSMVVSVLRRLAGRVPEARRAALCAILDPDTGDRVDLALVLFFPAPASFTGEDVAEFHLHGSLAIIRRVLAMLSSFPDCRLAEAGEFTRRAFLNGKMDLLEVEALSDVLAAETELQRRLAMEGSVWLRTQACVWRDRLLMSRAMAEALIDFGDEGDVIDQFDSATVQDIHQLKQDIDIVASRLRIGERVRAGYRIAILGPPNAGKSSLLNALADRDLAITSPIPGTTRDALEAMIDLDGLPVILIDTAGLRASPGDEIEAEGMRRAERAAEKADLVIWTTPFDSPAQCPNLSYLPVTTKADLAAEGILPVPAVSAITGSGLASLVGMIKTRALEGYEDSSLQGLIAHERQANALRSASEALGRATLSGQATLDLRAENLRLACDALDGLIGKIDPDEVLGAIFSRFCIGK